MTKKPNFFIIGAPKCGTTSLSSYLADHPNIYFSAPKEPHHFAVDIPSMQGVFADKEQYLKLFADATEEHLAIGEASVWYLYSDRALAAIEKFAPDAKLIVLLRNPVDMVRSLHGEWLFSQNEDQENFRKAWKLQESRAKGDALPPRLRHPNRFLQYGEIGKFSRRVEGVLSKFPREQIKFVLFDDFARSPGDVYRSVLEFLDVPDDGRAEFPKINARKTSKFPLLTLATRHAPKSISRLLNENSAIRNMKNQMIAMIDHWNSKPAEQSQLDEEFIEDLRDYFADDVRYLAELSDLDLERWNRVT